MHQVKANRDLQEIKDTIDVLLATYQGAAFLEEQLNSIFGQTTLPSQIIIRDDSSTDDTLKILLKFKELYPHLITLLPSQRRLGVKGNFSELMQHSSAEYIFFSDQDDIWNPNKIEMTLERMKKMERQYGKSTPLLVHTDLIVVGSDLKLIHPSFWKFTGLNPKGAELNRLLAQNMITGCTMVINRALLEQALPIPNEAMMHDWWVGLVAAAFGYIDFISLPTLQYRQHLSNDVGAKNYGLSRYILSYFKKNKQPSLFSKSCLQAARFVEQYNQSLNEKSIQLIATYAALEKMPYIKQKYTLFKNKFFKHGFLRNLRHVLVKN